VLIFDTSGKNIGQISSGLTPDKITSKYPFSQPGEMNEPIGIAVDAAGNVFVADTRNNRIQKFDKDGKPVAQWPVQPSAWSPGPYLEPFLALDSAGNLYVTAPTGKSVLKYDSTGKLEGQIGGALNLPTGIWSDPDGTLYVVDTGSSAVVKPPK
jgi:sugar lactone lactonase YvrE